MRKWAYKKQAGEDITSLLGALANVGEDEDEHIDANIPVSVIGLTDGPRRLCR